MSKETPQQEPTSTVVEEPTPPRRGGSRVAIYVTVIIVVLAVGAGVWFTRFNTQTPVLAFYPSQQLTSADWSGYTVSSDLTAPQADVTAVTGTWVVPNINGTNDSFSAAWIGIGGQYDESLIQTGTEHSILNNTASYFAWYELLPDNSIYLNMTVNPGDTMSASISLQNSASNTWLVILKNLSNGETYQNTFQYASTRSSAEWIVERPTVNNFQYPLADFGTITFTGCSATIGGRVGSITGFPHSVVNMRGRMGNDLVRVGDLSPDGASFGVTFIASR